MSELLHEVGHGFISRSSGREYLRHLLLVNIGLENNLLPVWCQFITWTNADFLNDDNSFEKFICKMAAILFRPQCVNRVNPTCGRTDSCQGHLIHCLHRMAGDNRRTIAEDNGSWIPKAEDKTTVHERQLMVLERYANREGQEPSPEWDYGCWFKYHSGGILLPDVRGDAGGIFVSCVCISTAWKCYDFSWKRYDFCEILSGDLWWSWWVSARKTKLQCISNGVTSCTKPSKYDEWRCIWNRWDLHGDTYMRQRIGSALVQVMAWCLFGIKPLPESMLT